MQFYNIHGAYGGQIFAFSDTEVPSSLSEVFSKVVVPELKGMPVAVGPASYFYAAGTTAKQWDCFAQSKAMMTVSVELGLTSLDVPSPTRSGLPLPAGQLCITQASAPMRSSLSIDYTLAWPLAHDRSIRISYFLFVIDGCLQLHSHQQRFLCRHVSMYQQHEGKRVTCYAPNNTVRDCCSFDAYRAIDDNS